MKYYCNKRSLGREYNGENCKAVKSAEDNKRRLMDEEKKKADEKKNLSENEKRNKSKNKFKNNSDEDMDEDLDEDMYEDLGGIDNEVIIPPGCSKEYMEDYLEGSGLSVEVYSENESSNCKYNKNDSKVLESDSKDIRYMPKRDAVQYFIPNNKRKNEIGLCGNISGNIADNMKGRYNLLSVPDLTQNKNGLENKNGKVTLSAYLDNYRGKFICLDLWTVQQNRIEKCGVLEEIGADFLAIRNSRGGIMLIDLKSVRYISVFCR